MKLFLSILFVFIWLTGCDPEHRKKCEWYLMPDATRIGRVQEGFIPVCARNLVVNKEDCRLQATLDFAKESYNKKFRYIDMKVKSAAIPRSVDTIKFCE